MFLGIIKMVNNIKKGRVYGTYEDNDNNIYTENLVWNHKTYNEKLVEFRGKQYRLWDPYRSKIGAFIRKGKKVKLHNRMNVLYLGASTGTTVSHVSDIMTKGNIFAVEFGPRVFRDLYLECEYRDNILPILDDANKPKNYLDIVTEVDFLFQDVAQKNQVEIFSKNAKYFLKNNSLAMISIKARSIDSTKKPKKVFRDVKKKLKSNKFEIIDSLSLNPYEKDHEMIVCSYNY